MCLATEQEVSGAITLARSRNASQDVVDRVLAVDTAPCTVSQPITSPWFLIKTHYPLFSGS